MAGKTCDRFLCRAHAKDKGRGVQFCPAHAVFEKAIRAIAGEEG
jgi:hypothetical protein